MSEKTQRLIPLVCGLLLIILCGCMRGRFQKITPLAEDDAVAKHYIEMLRQDQFEPIQKDLGPDMNGFNHDLFEQMRAMIPAGEPSSVKVVSCVINTSPTSHFINIGYEYQFPEKWLLINVAVMKKDGLSTIVGFNIKSMPDSLENLNRFTLSGTNADRYVMLFLVCVVPLFILYALVLCIRTKMKKRKLLWVIFIIFGAGKLTLNWTTGQVTSVPGIIQYDTVDAHNTELVFFAAQLFGVGAIAYGHGPWLLSVSLPLGAMVFFLRRKELMVKQPQPASVEG
jgi:hypothetical protein